MSTESLSACPFCGRELDITDFDTVHPSGIMWREEPGGFRSYHSYKERRPDDNYCYVINCVEHYGGCGVSMSGDSKEEAIFRWNRRR